MNLPKIIVLNLRRDLEKRQNLITQFEKLGIIDYLFFPAIDAKCITNNIDIKIGTGYGLGRSLSKVEIAITLSHINILNFANVSNLENVIILEDDIILCEDFKERINGILNKLPENWEHVYLSGHSDYVNFPILDVEKIEISPKIVGSFSYMTNKKGYQKIIDFCLSFMTTYDDLIMQMNSLKRLNSYVVFPFLTHIGDFFSENGQSITSNHSSRKFFKKQIKNYI